MANSKSSQVISDWKRIREQGVWRYVFTRGFLTAGLAFALITVFIEVLILEKELRPVRLAVRALLFGVFFGAFNWSWNERKYKRQLDSNA